MPMATIPAQARDAGTSDAAIRARVDALIAQMTPAEKAGQLSLYFYIPKPPISTELDKGIADGTVGNALFVSDAATTNRLQRIAMTESRLKIPLLFGFDVIHGLHTIMPVPLALAASWDPKLAEQVQAQAAAEARAVGISWTFAPNADIARDPRWGRIVEGAGEDPFLGSAMAAAQVRGFQGSGLGSPDHILSGPKHFAGYGASLGGRDYDEANISDDELWNVYLPPFKAALDAGAGNIMSAYMPLNGVPAVSNSWLLTDVLRKKWGFKGFVVSDANAVNSLVVQGLVPDTSGGVQRAIEAGMDMEMAGAMQPAAAKSIPNLLKNGKLTDDQINQAVARILETKIRLGLFEKPYVDEAKATAVWNAPQARELARTAAERSAVLLRNEANLLPLDRKMLRSVAVIGPLADAAHDMLGSWTFPQNRPSAVSLLNGLRHKLGPDITLRYAEGARMPARINPSLFASLEPPAATAASDEAGQIAEAVTIAKASDVAVLALGEGQNMSGEKSSRTSLSLPGKQQELLDAVIATGKPVVVLLFSARPLDLKGSKPAAIIDMWYPGSEGGNAAANLLFGDAVPGGKLPISWIADAAHGPNTYAQYRSFDEDKADRHYWDVASSKPIWPFGFGLSYTSFDYSDLRTDQTSYLIDQPIKISVNLRNSGARAADEVAQLYVHQRYGTSVRPRRLLKGFERVHLRPGERKTITFTLQPGDLSYWSSVTRDWVNDASQFDIWVGGNSDASLASSFEVRNVSR